MDKGHGSCDFSLMALDVPPPKGPLFIFGDPFLRRFVTIYDKNGPKVGFAVAKHGGMDSSMADRIIATVDGIAQAGQSSESAKLQAYNPKQVTMSLESGMMMGDSEASGDDSSSEQANAAETWEHAEEEEDDFDKDEPTLTKTSIPASAAKFKFRSPWDSSLPGFHAHASEPSSAKDGLGSESAPSSSSGVPSKNNALAEMDELLGKSSPAGSMWIQQHAQGFKGSHHANRLVSVQLHKTEAKLFL